MRKNKNKLANTAAALPGEMLTAAEKNLKVSKLLYLPGQFSRTRNVWLGALVINRVLNNTVFIYFFAVVLGSIYAHSFINFVVNRGISLYLWGRAYSRSVSVFIYKLCVVCVFKEKSERTWTF